MRVYKAVFTLAFTVVAATGCAGGISQINPTGALPGHAVATPSSMRSEAIVDHLVTTPSFMNPNAAGKPLLFVSNLDGGVVNIYLQHGSKAPVGQVTGLAKPYSIATDSAGNLYVANATSANIQVYAPPYTGAPARTLDDGTYMPFDVAISPRGVVGVANYCLQPSCNVGTGNIVFYAKNSTTPCATLSDSNTLAYMEYGSFDGKGNFFVNGFDSNRHTVLGEIEGGCNAKRIVILTAGALNGNQGGVHVNETDQISILDTQPPGQGPVVLYTYGRPVKHSLGNPLSTAMLLGTARSPILEDFAFQGGGANIYVPDFTDGNTNEYAYPAGGMPERTIGLGKGQYISGIAVTPPLIR
jgi:hypothetical protein